MTAEIVARVLSSSRYRDVDPGLVHRLAEEEGPRSRSQDEAVKRVKRRLHQAVGAFAAPADRTRADPLAAVRAAWRGDMTDPVFRAACAAVLASHASTRERVPDLERLYDGIWARTGVPLRLADIGCGIAPLALPWMHIGSATYLASDVDGRSLEVVRAFFELVGHPHVVTPLDAVTSAPAEAADVALLLKLVPTLDRQDETATRRVVDGLRARQAVVSFPVRSLGGRGKGMERTYRDRVERLGSESARVREIADVSVPSELAFVLTMEDRGG